MLGHDSGELFQLADMSERLIKQRPFITKDGRPLWRTAEKNQF